MPAVAVTTMVSRPLCRAAHTLTRIAREEAAHVRHDVRQGVRLTIGFALALFCVSLVIVGNVVLLIAINFWIATFPAVTVQHNSSQIALQTVVALLLLAFFGTLHALFMCYVGAASSWRALVATDRVRGPLYRLLLIFVSGASQAVTNLLATYSMTYTPAFIQAILLCCIPFATQAVTVACIREERQRNYRSVLFVSSFVCFIAGVLLASMSAFVTRDATAVPWSWTLVYLLSSVTFGVWCVAQRLYLDAVLPRQATDNNSNSNNNNNNNEHKNDSHEQQPQQQPHDVPQAHAVAVVGDDDMAGCSKANVYNNKNNNNGNNGSSSHQNNNNDNNALDDEAIAHARPSAAPRSSSEAALDDELSLSSSLPGAHKQRRWGRQAEDDVAAKFVLLVCTLVCQAMVTLVLFPIDALPWFGTSPSVAVAWTGLCQSFDFIFSSWHHIRYGLLYSLGIGMSFVGCIYLSEHSPTLASVVMQLAGPITSIVLLLVPQWNLMSESSPMGYKVGGVVLLFCAALLYHFWDQRSLRLLARLQREKRQEQQQEQQQVQHDNNNDNNNNDDDGALRTRCEPVM